MDKQKKAEQMFKKALDAVEKHNLFFVKDAYSYIGVPESTFYEYIPAGSEFSEILKEAITKNKAKTLISLRGKLHNSTSPTALLALYKLICSDEERKKLSMQYNDVTTNGENINHVTFEYVRPSDKG